MNIYCIVCSRKKQETTEPIAAIDLYLSSNIKDVYELSKRDGLEFRILSGKFGLLKADDKIENYDFLLKEENVDELKEKIKAQIFSQKINGFTFFAENRDRHPNWKPYYSAIIKVCEELNIGLNFVEVGD